MLDVCDKLLPLYVRDHRYTIARFHALSSIDLEPAYRTERFEQL